MSGLGKKQHVILPSNNLDTYSIDFYRDKTDEKDNFLSRMLIGHKDGTLRTYKITKQ